MPVYMVDAAHSKDGWKHAGVAIFLLQGEYVLSLGSMLLAAWAGLPFGPPVGVLPAPWGVFGIIEATHQVF